MKLYATTTSERASKGQGGNKYLDIDIFTTSKEKPTHKLKVWQNDEFGHIWITLYAQHFDKWQELASDMIFINIVKEKGKKQQGENKCKVCGMGSESEPESDDCIF